jgi:formylmethanofuran dehydrogenase subunit E
MNELLDYLNASQARHSHLCPRQVLGVRIALAALAWLDLEPLAKRRKHLLVICETNGCFVDGIEVAARVSVGHRTLRVEDYGKIAATFVDLRTARALRLHPAAGIRELAREYFPLEKRAYFSQLKGYQIIPDDELLHAEWVTLAREADQIMGSARQRACCSGCGEEIINGREISQEDITLCMACAGQAYYRPAMRAEIMENAG